MAHTSNIDDILIGGKTDLQPSTPEKANEVDVPRETSPTVAPEAPNDDYGIDDEQAKETDTKAEGSETADRPATDEYGNDKPPSKMYSEEEVSARINEAVRDRLARFERNNGQQQPSQQQVQNQAQGFEYNADSPETWQQQLETFVETTVAKMSQKQAQQAKAQRDQQAQAEYEVKFSQGMRKFKDYADVVRSQPITDAMVLASRGISDPAAFFYAASKRMPQELERISRMPDEYAQMVEIGRLEERMRKAKPGTSAPKPVGRTQEDSTIAHKSDRQPSIEELIGQADAKKRAALERRRR